MDETNYFNRYAAISIIALLVLLAFFLIKPILTPIFFSFVLALVLFRPYMWLVKKTKTRNLSALIICVSLIAVIFIPFLFLLPSLLNQSINVYLAIQKIDFNSLFIKIHPITIKSFLGLSMLLSSK